MISDRLLKLRDEAVAAERGAIENAAKLTAELPKAETGPAPEKWAMAFGAEDREPFAGVGIGSSTSSPTGMVTPPTE